MPNPKKAEVPLTLGDGVKILCFDMNAMAELEDASFGGMGDDGDSDDDGGSFSASVASPAAALAFPAHRSIFEDGIHFDARGQHAVFDAVVAKPIVLDEDAKIDDKGVLRLKGHFDTKIGRASCRERV